MTRSRDAQRRPAHLKVGALGELTEWLERYQRQAEKRFSRLENIIARMEQHDDPR